MWSFAESYFALHTFKETGGKQRNRQERTDIAILRTSQWIRRLVAGCLLALALTAGALATETNGRNLIGHDKQWERRGYFGFHIGFVGIGELKTDTARFETKAGFTFGVKFDSRIRWPWYWGVTADIHRLHILDTGQYLFDLTLNLRRSYFSNSAKVAFRPGIGAGFGYLANFREYEPTAYLLLKGGMEVIFYSDEKIAYVIELQIMGSPLGGRAGQSYTLKPMVVGRVGILL
jgi:hypothetical protein